MGKEKKFLDGREGITVGGGGGRRDGGGMVSKRGGAGRRGARTSRRGRGGAGAGKLADQSRGDCGGRVRGSAPTRAERESMKAFSSSTSPSGSDGAPPRLGEAGGDCRPDGFFPARASNRKIPKRARMIQIHSPFITKIPSQNPGSSHLGRWRLLRPPHSVRLPRNDRLIGDQNLTVIRSASFRPVPSRRSIPASGYRT